MKKVFILMALFAITAGAAAQLKIAANGNVGIGNPNPAYNLDVKGKLRFSLYGQGWEDIFLDGQNQWGASQLYCKTVNFQIGTPTYLVNCVYVNWLYYKNSIKLLTNPTPRGEVKPLGNVLDKILAIEAKRYNNKQDTPDHGILEFEALLEKETFGFIAQELEQIFPELVDAPSAVNNDYAIDYIGMIPVLVEAIKEQQMQIDSIGNSLYLALKTINSQQSQIDRLQVMIENQIYEISSLQDEIKVCCQENAKNLSPQQPPAMDENNDQEGNPVKNTAINENNTSDVEKAKLFQNVPNPFSTNTEIRFEIPENSVSAKLLIHDMQGAEIKSHIITTKGAGNITIQAHELPAGMYMYTLLVNNTIVDTKKMILTK